MSNLHTASNMWANVPDENRYATLATLFTACELQRQASAEREFKASQIRVEGVGDTVYIGNADKGAASIPVGHWAFGQLAARAKAPAEYLRSLPAPLAASCIADGLSRRSDASPDCFGLFQKTDGKPMLRALTSDRYDRVWDSAVVHRAMSLESQGWKVPPARPCRSNQAGTRVATEADVLANSAHKSLGVKVGDLIAPAGLYKGESYLFIFMVDDSRPIDDGSGSIKYRGFFMRNSEVGGGVIELVCFLYDSVCANHICWGATNITRTRARHIGNSATRAFSELAPTLKAYSMESDSAALGGIASARKMLLGDTRQDVLSKVFAKKISGLSMHTLDNAFVRAYDRHTGQLPDRGYGAPETLWGLVSGLTEVSQEETHADARHAIDSGAGKLLAMAVK